MKQKPDHLLTDEALLSYLQREAAPDADTSWIDVQQEWQTFRQSVQNVPAKPSKGVVATIRFLRMAAIWLLLAGIALFLIVYPPFSRRYQIAATVQVITQNLPDGSVVTLNKQSTLFYDRDYNKENRSITLSGEAFFSVAPNTKLPFIVRSGIISAEVLGTSFNLNATADKTELIVETGRVKLETTKGTLILNAGEMVMVAHNDTRLQKQPVTDSLYSYYRTSNFSCKNTPLSHLLAALNNTYGIQITTEHAADENLPLTADFNQVPVDDIIQVICTTLHFTPVKHGDAIVLKRV